MRQGQGQGQGQERDRNGTGTGQGRGRHGRVRVTWVKTHVGIPGNEGPIRAKLYTWVVGPEVRPRVRLSNSLRAEESVMRRWSGVKREGSEVGG